MEYSEAYFTWQKRVGEFGGLANRFKFSPYIKQTDTVLDFGCGGGYLLENLDCAEKYGLEINPVARQEAQSRGLTVYDDLAQVPDNLADVVVSNHTLEHVYRPLDELQTLLPKLKAGGTAVFVVPHQKPGEKYHDQDINQHLYTWNPMTLGNLFKAAGYVNIQADTIRHRWPPKYRRIRQVFGEQRFDTISRVNALLTGHYQIRVVAQRPSDA